MSQYTRKFDGPTIQERRKTDPVPVKPTPGVPPHKVQRVYRLEVITETVSERRETYSYASKAARDQSKRQMIKEARNSRYSNYNWTRGHMSQKHAETLTFEESETAPETVNEVTK